MKKQYFAIIALILFACPFCGIAQSLDTLAQQKVYKDTFRLKKIILPASLVASGLVLRTPAWRQDLLELRNSIFEPCFKTKIDDYIQYLPMIQTFAGKSLGISSKHSYKQIITNQVVSNVICAAIVHGLKISIADMRPDGSKNNAFPSGHTANAFTNATLQYLEYKKGNKWYAASGFVFVSATGILRVANTRHWPGDVVAGAGIGMATAIVVHYWSPFKWDEKKTNKKISYITYPIINDKNYGIGLIGKLN